jgi:hypothetical protein
MARTMVGSMSMCDRGDLDTPGIGGGVQNFLDVGIELVAFGQHFI